MFGAVGTLLFILVMRVLVIHAWRHGIGLALRFRLLTPLLAIALGLLVLRHDVDLLLTSAASLAIVVQIAVTVGGGVARARTARLSGGPEDTKHPRGVHVTATRATLAVDLGALVAAAVIAFGIIAPGVSLTAAAGTLAISLALGDLASSAALMHRARPVGPASSGERPPRSVEPEGAARDGR